MRIRHLSRIRLLYHLPHLEQSGYACIPTFGHYSSSNANMQGPSTNQTSSDDSYTISPSNTTAANSSYTPLYINSFYQNDDYATPLVRAFDSYTSSDGGNTWTAPTSGIAAVAFHLVRFDAGRRRASFHDWKHEHLRHRREGRRGQHHAGTPSWELDGYSNYTNGSLSNAASGQSNYTSAPFTVTRRGPATTARPSSSGPPTRAGRYHPRAIPLRSSSSLPISATPLPTQRSTTGPPLEHWLGKGQRPASTNWPWPNDGGTSLGSYLTIEGLHSRWQPQAPDHRSALSEDHALYPWNYVIDNWAQPPATGGCDSSAPPTTPCSSTRPGP